MLGRCMIILCLGLVFLATSSWSAENQPQALEDFLKRRNVLVAVEFTPGSNELSSSARYSLDQAILDIKGLLGEKKLVRIEGYAATAGKQNQDLLLSMQRAMLVQFYLQKHYGLELDLFFNGYGSSKKSDSMVELAFYEDTLGLAAAEFDEVITE